MYEEFWQHFETHNLKTIETYGEIWKHFEAHNLKTIETYGEIWKHFGTDDLKTIETYEEIWKHFETHNLKTLKPMGKFENTLKHIVSPGEAFYGLGTASNSSSSCSIAKCLCTKFCVLYAASLFYNKMLGT